MRPLAARQDASCEQECRASKMVRICMPWAGQIMGPLCTCSLHVRRIGLTLIPPRQVGLRRKACLLLHILHQSAHFSDPLLTWSVPCAVTANSGVDARCPQHTSTGENQDN